MKEYVKLRLGKILKSDSPDDRLDKLMAIYADLYERGYKTKQIARIVNDCIADNLLELTNSCLRLMREVEDDHGN